MRDIKFLDLGKQQNTIKKKLKYNIEKVIGHYEVDDVKKCPSFNVKEWLEKNGMV